MAFPERPTPHVEDLPGGWIETPADTSRAQSYTGVQQSRSMRPSAVAADRPNGGTLLDYTTLAGSSPSARAPRHSSHFSSSSHSTAVPSPDGKASLAPTEPLRRESVDSESSIDSKPSFKHDEASYTAIKPASSAPARPPLGPKRSKQMTEDDLFRVLSRRRTSVLGRTDTVSTASSTDDEQAEINKLMSRMFGRTRQESSEEEKTRHAGVVFKHLTVKGMGVGAALQPSVGDLFLGLPRLLKNLVTKGPRKAAGKPPVRTILDDFSGCVKPGEMLLVLGRPGAGRLFIPGRCLLSSS